MNPFKPKDWNCMTRSFGGRVLRVRGIAMMGAISILFVSLAAPVLAQSDTGSQNALVREIERLRRDLSDMQRFVYRGDNSVVPPNVASDKPVDADTSSRLQRQIIEIQAQIRELTGHIERTQHDVRMLGVRLDKLVADVDIRLQALEGGGPVASANRQSLDGSRTATAPAVRRDETTVISSGGVTGAGLAPGQESLGQISGKDLAAVKSGQRIPTASPQTGPQIAAPVRPAPPPPIPQAAPVRGGVTSSVASVARPLTAGELPEGTTRQQYEYAFGKLKERDYDAAENALRTFVDRNPDDPLAGNAMYWMGETYYVRKQFSEAARIFLDAYQRFPKGNKAPDNLFKLAKSLVQIGETQSACTTYSELVKTFPSANRRILSGAKTDMTRLGCG